VGTDERAGETQERLQKVGRWRVRSERRADILTRLLHLVCALLCARRLDPLEES